MKSSNDNDLKDTNKKISSSQRLPTGGRETESRYSPILDHSLFERQTDWNSSRDDRTQKVSSEAGRVSETKGVGIGICGGKECENLKNWLVKFPTTPDNGDLPPEIRSTGLRTQDDLEKSSKAYEAIVYIKSIETINYIITMEELFKLQDYSTNHPNNQLYIQLIPLDLNNQKKTPSTSSSLYSEFLPDVRREALRRETTSNTSTSEGSKTQSISCLSPFGGSKESLNITKSQTDTPEGRTVQGSLALCAERPLGVEPQRSSATVNTSSNSHTEGVTAKLGTNDSKNTSTNNFATIKEKIPSPREFKTLTRTSDPESNRHRRSSSPSPIDNDFKNTNKHGISGMVSILSGNSTKKISPRLLRKEKGSVSPRKIKIYEKEYEIDFSACACLGDTNKYSIFIIDHSLNNTLGNSLPDEIVVLVCQGLTDSLVDPRMLKNFKEKTVYIKVLDKRITVHPTAVDVRGIENQGDNNSKLEDTNVSDLRREHKRELEINTRKIDVKVYAEKFDNLTFPIFFVIGSTEEYTTEEFLGLVSDIMNECKK
jgi:hypothetical protein